MNTNRSGSQEAWALIDAERRRDRVIRRICIVSWCATLAVAILFASIVGVSVVQMAKAAAAGEVPWATVVGTAMPFIGSLWTLCLLAAALSTIGVFLRQRSTSLSEIQLRLAALEDMLASSDRGEGPSTGDAK